MLINTKTSTDEGSENKSLEGSALNTHIYCDPFYQNWVIIMEEGVEKLLDVKAMYDYKEVMLFKHRWKTPHVKSK